jgi:hypothetical protein
VEPAEESRAYITFLVPKAQEAALPAFLATLDARRQELGVTDLQISLTSLEEVFLSIARRAEVEAAAGETAAVELPDGGTVEVALGEEWATDAQGRHYFIRWAQDDSGALQVLKAEPVQARPATLAGAGGAAVAPEGGASGSSGPGSSTGGEPVQQAPQVVEMARSAP